MDKLVGWILECEFPMRGALPRYRIPEWKLMVGSDTEFGTITGIDGPFLTMTGHNHLFKIDVYPNSKHVALTGIPFYS